jgi:hypothetical protein
VGQPRANQQAQPQDGYVDANAVLAKLEEKLAAALKSPKIQP